MSSQSIVLGMASAAQVAANTAAIALKANQTALDDLLQWTPQGGQHLFARPIIGGTNTTLCGLTSATATGAATGRVLADTNYGTRRHRIGFLTTASAGTLAGMRVLGSSSVAPIQGNTGYRAVFRQVISAVSASMRWFMGATTGISAPTNVDPASLTDNIGIGSNGNANVQLYYNDASGVATQLDLGANFPALTANVAYELILYAAPGGASILWKVRRLDAAFTATGTISTNLPTAATFLMPNCWCTNNADASVVSIDWMGFDIFVPT